MVGLPLVEIQRHYSRKNLKINKIPSSLSVCSRRTIFDEGELLEFAKLGSYLEYDLFGIEMLNYPYNLEVDMPSDSQRVKA